ncbi:hypothetical protein LSH36_12g14038 [Paralvinella palmiformis]|uniref:Uncharacterized protein n=1 Tax=Paralvinella palmiformis TaxID=53620 RepID=A0AAD9KEN4_9ANNE|nr:hypothetical protein LSH36_12g14038 [Paralvinella palmiformis]
MSNEISAAKIHPKEYMKLEQFKYRVKDLIQPHHDDYYLHKWLKARSFDVEKAEKMFRDSMALREKLSVDRLLEEYNPPEVLQKYLAGGLCGFDKEGSPVSIERYGYLDMKGLMCSSKKSDLEKTKLRHCEQIVKQLEEQTKRLGRRVDGLTVIFDMENSGTKQLWRPGVQMYVHLVKLLEDNYPETLKRLLVINAPRIFPILWKLGRPLVSDDMKKKIFVLSSNYSVGLKEFIDPDNLPKFLGGNMTDPDGNPLCQTMICHGGTVPTHYYISECGDTEGTETVTISKGDRLELEFDVELPGSLIRWEFRTEDYDIAFGIEYRHDNQKGEEVVPLHRVDSQLILQDDVFIFDNHYAWTRSKVLHYLVELHTPDDGVTAEVDCMAIGGSWTRVREGIQITHL